MTEAVVPLAIPMIKPALGTSLMTGVGSSALLKACVRPACVTAVLLPAVAGTADPEKRAAAVTAARTLTQNDFQPVGHSRPHAGLDNGRRSCQVTALRWAGLLIVERRAFGIPAVGSVGIPLLPPVAGNLHQIVRGIAPSARMMLRLACRRVFRKLRFQMIDDTFISTDPQIGGVSSPQGAN